MDFRILFALAGFGLFGYCLADKDSSSGAGDDVSMPNDTDSTYPMLPLTPAVYLPPPPPAVPLPFSPSTPNSNPIVPQPMEPLPFYPVNSQGSFADEGQSVIMNYLQSVFQNAMNGMEMQQLLGGDLPADPEMTTGNFSAEEIVELLKLWKLFQNDSTGDTQEFRKDLAGFEKFFGERNESDDEMRDMIDQLLQQAIGQYGGFAEMMEFAQQQVQQELTAVLQNELTNVMSEMNDKVTEQGKELGIDKDTFKSAVVGVNCTTELACPAGHMILILMMHYGSIDSALNPYGGQFAVTDCQGSDNEMIVKALCEYQQTCNVTVNDYMFDMSCLGEKSLHIEYACLSEDVSMEQLNTVEEDSEEILSPFSQTMTENSQQFPIDMAEIEKILGQGNQSDDEILDIINQLLQQQPNGPNGEEPTDQMQEIAGEVSEEMEELGLGQDAFRSAVVCENCTAELVCPAGHMIMILMTHYGPIDSTLNPDDGEFALTDCQGSDSEIVVRALCEYRRACDVTADDNMFNTSCPGEKYLQIEYACLSEDGKA